MSRILTLVTHTHCPALQVETTGDVPSPRSGHSTVAYGKLMFLFGGINFTDEAVYNDLYVLNTATWEWKYVGEKGEIIQERNSHSLEIIDGSSRGMGKYLLVYGGASPASGPLGDAYYAPLWLGSEELALGLGSFFVDWQRLDCPGRVPVPREMHGTCAPADKTCVYILGGRDERGGILSDVWRLSVCEAGQVPPLGWQECPSLRLPTGCCAHTASWVGGNSLCVFGGFRENSGISGELLVADVEDSGLDDGSGAAWVPRLSNRLPSALEPRFGHCASTVRLETTSALLVFGGVNAEKDFADLWVVTPPADCATEAAAYTSIQPASP
jgi:Kelch motif